MSRPPQALVSLGVLLGGWIGIRVAFNTIFLPVPPTFPEHPWREIVSAEVVPQAAAKELTISLPPPEPLRARRVSVELSTKPLTHRGPEISPQDRALSLGAAALPKMSRTPELQQIAEMPGTSLPKTSGAGRNWSVSAWALYRRGHGAQDIAPNGHLGGSQAGMRLQRRVLSLSPRMKISANARISLPLAGRGGQEAAIGISVGRTAALPLELLVEHRVAIGRGARNAFAATALTGINDAVLPLSFRLNGYAQAGMVGLRSRDGFVDGALRVERGVAEINDIRFDLGMGVWGAVQPGVSRLDIGPSAALRFRLGKASLRAAAEWRERIAGHARPGSGPSLTLGVDY